MSIIKGKSVINLSILTLSDGEKINTVKDIIFDPIENKVKAFLVDQGGWFKGAKIIYTDDVKSIGDNALTILSSDSVKSLDEVDSKVFSIINQGSEISNDEVYTYDGNMIGKLLDIHFEFPSGDVKYLEISQGMASIMSGTKLISTDDILTIGKDKIIVKNIVEEKVNEQAQNQGVSGFINSTKDKLGGGVEVVKQGSGNLASTIKTKTSEVSQVIGEKASQIGSTMSQGVENAQKSNSLVINDSTKTQLSVQTENLVDDTSVGIQEAGEGVKQIGSDIVTGVKNILGNANQKVEDTRISGAIGKILNNTIILSTSDEILAKPGDLITHKLVEQARANGKLDLLLNNVTDLQPA